MKYSIIAILMLAVVGCSEGSEPVTNSLYNDQINVWQSREAQCQSTMEITQGYTALADILNALDPLILDPPFFTYQHEDIDYWQSSCEMEVNGVGDCEDIAALWYANIRKHKIVPDHLLFFRIIEYVDGRRHNVLVIQTDEGEIYFNNGKLMSKLNDHTILAEYDLWTIYF